MIVMQKNCHKSEFKTDCDDKKKYKSYVKKKKVKSNDNKKKLLEN
jgi:hypothetical protein